MKTTINMTEELWNLLTLNEDDQLEDYTREDILKMIQEAHDSVWSQTR